MRSTRRPKSKLSKERKQDIRDAVMKNLGGRPEFSPTAKQRRIVAISKAGGMSHAQIAATLGVSIPTLEKHCGDELTIGAEVCRQELILLIHGQAIRGRLPAIRMFQELEGKKRGPGRPPARPQELNPEKPYETPPEKKGLKQQRDDAAVGAEKGTKWENLSLN